MHNLLENQFGFSNYPAFKRTFSQNKLTDPFKLNPNLNGNGYYHCLKSQRNHAWRCLVSYCEYHGIPNVGQKIYVDELIASSLEITGVINDYVYTPSSELEEKCKKAHNDVIAKIKARKK